jgi:hypothetical protein
MVHNDPNSTSVKLLSLWNVWALAFPWKANRFPVEGTVPGPVTALPVCEGEGSPCTGSH